MLKIKTADGAVFIGEDHRAIVRAMRNDEWNAPQRKGDWMHTVQRRVLEMTGEMIRTDAVGFLTDLERVGLAQITEDVA